MLARMCAFAEGMDIAGVRFSGSLLPGTVMQVTASLGGRETASYLKVIEIGVNQPSFGVSSTRFGEWGCSFLQDGHSEACLERKRRRDSRSQGNLRSGAAPFVPLSRWASSILRLSSFAVLWVYAIQRICRHILLTKVSKYLGI